MPIQRLVAYLGECRRRLADLRGRQDYSALTCAILRPEGAGGTVLYDRPFSRILNDRPFHDCLTASHTETFAIAFYSGADGIQADQIPAALAPVEAITRKIYPLLRQLPETVLEGLRLPDTDNWWRILFHLGWHFPRPFLSPVRCRLLAREATLWSIYHETFVQLHGTAGQSDLLPGLIYSALQDNDDLCTCSETAVGIIIDALERHFQAAQFAESGAPGLSADQRRAFDQLRLEYLAGTQMPQPLVDLECMLLKLANSFETPPASTWASIQVGGCVERFFTLSRLNDSQELVQIRGAATEWFCKLAERAGNALPACIPDCSILFDDPQRGFSGSYPVMNRAAIERWIGFIFATIKKHRHEALRIRWETHLGPLYHGIATLDRDLFGASVLAIDLARFTTAAEDASNREREACSPFSVPSMEELGFQWAGETPPPSAPPATYTLGHLVEDLRHFGERYCQAAEQIEEQNPIIAKRSSIELGAFVSHARDSLQRIPGFNALREQVRSLWSQEISFAAARRIVDTLVQRSNGGFSAGAAEGLTLTEAVVALTAPPESLPIQAPAGEFDNQTTDDRLHIDDIDSFEKVRTVPPSAVTQFLKQGNLGISEESVKRAIEEILHVPFRHKDRPDELDDIYTANVIVNGSRRPTAFMLKGPGIGKKEMTIADCGKNGDQLVRLFDAPADLFVVQFVGRIAEMVIKDVEGKVAALHKRGKKAQFVIFDGQDTARLLLAYSKLNTA